MSISSTIALLEGNLANIAGSPAIQLENTVYNDTGDPWLRATLLPATSQLMTIGVGAQKKMQGLYQVDCICPEDLGSAQAHQLADAVVDAYPIGLRLTDGTTTVIIELASALPALPLLTYYYVPVQIQWSVYE